MASYQVGPLDEQGCEIAGMGLPGAGRHRRELTKFTRHVRLVVETAGKRDVGERTPLPHAPERGLQPHDPRERFRREPDVFAKLALHLAEAGARARSDRVDGRAPAAAQDGRDHGFDLMPWRRARHADQPTLERAYALAVARCLSQTVAQAPGRRINEFEVDEPARHFLQREAEECPGRRGTKPDRRHTRRPLGRQDDRRDHLSDEQ